MEYKIDDSIYNVIIIKKSNKNTYLRVNDNLDIIVTTSYLMPKYKIKSLLEQNKVTIKKMIDKKINKSTNFYYLGKKYDIIINDKISDILIKDDILYAKSVTVLNKWLEKEINTIFNDRLKIVYRTFEEKIPFPGLKIRNMKSRWGVCNKKGYITLNSNLIKYSISEIDYVIVHELSHFVYFNHSKDFWNLVSKYCSNYKDCRKKLKE